MADGAALGWERAYQFHSRRVCAGTGTDEASSGEYKPAWRHTGPDSALQGRILL